MKYLFLPFFLFLFIKSVFALTVSDIEAKAIGEKIWRNECRGTIEGLTHWNKGEDFASLGIGHFIWYPLGGKGPFDETFPALLKFLEKRKVDIPHWLKDVLGVQKKGLLQIYKVKK